MKFQLTTSQGGRRCKKHQRLSRQFISTHDLARRSTFWICFLLYSSPISTHDLARRSTFSMLEEIDFSLTFQLTTSQGGRHLSLSRRFESQYFNSRPRKEVDPEFLLIWDAVDISTHDLARRSTGETVHCCSEAKFQLTTSQGGRPIMFKNVNL